MHRGVKKRVKAVKNVKTVLLILVSLFASLFWVLANICLCLMCLALLKPEIDP